MALSLPHHDHFTAHPDVAGLSTATVHNASVDRVYAKLSPVYDVVFGAVLQPGRVAAIDRMAIQPGNRVLEVGAGTGLTISLYPRDCHVTAIDLSAPMLERARARVARERLTHVRLLEADAASMTFADDTFDSVFAPYVISVVPDPVRVAHEMRRVCRPGGRIVLLNHFRSTNRMWAWVERLISPFTVHIGFKADLDMAGLLRQTRLRPISIEKVNFPPIWSVVTCIKN
jgi:phosphatidylethanolamine/phosphatidyl-N-methylethanolamine N-methyltransferase